MNAIERKTQEFYSAEVLYATADAAHHSDTPAASFLLEDNLDKYIKEDNIRHILSDKTISIKQSPNRKSFNIAINDNSLSKEERIDKLEEIVKLMMEVH